MKRAALLCTFSSFSISAVVYGSQTDAAYSSDDLTHTGEVCYTASLCWAVLNISPDKPQCRTGFFAHIVYMGVPFQIVADHDS